MTIEEQIFKLQIEWVQAPDWIRTAFEPYYEAVSLLINLKQFDLAYDIVKSIPVSIDLTNDQIIEFLKIKESILLDLNNMIDIKNAVSEEIYKAYLESIKNRGPL